MAAARSPGRRVGAAPRTLRGATTRVADTGGDHETRSDARPDVRCLTGRSRGHDISDLDDRRRSRAANPCRAESGGNYENDGAIRPYGWENVLVEGVRFANCAAAVSLYVPADYPSALGPSGNFVVRNNTFIACGRARAAGANVELIHSSSACSGINFWDVQVTGNVVDGEWVAGTACFVATWDTHNTTITGNHFAPTNMTVAEERAYNKYKGQGPSNTGTWNLSGNTVSDGSIDNS